LILGEERGTEEKEEEDAELFDDKGEEATVRRDDRFMDLLRAGDGVDETKAGVERFSLSFLV